MSAAVDQAQQVCEACEEPFNDEPWIRLCSGACEFCEEPFCLGPCACERDRAECVRSGTHELVLVGRASLEDDPPHSSRPVYSCGSCQWEQIGGYSF